VNFESEKVLLMSQEFYVRNVSESMVDMVIGECMAEAEMCTCPRCVADVKAYALNHFPPHYVVTDLGDLLTRADALSYQFRADLITAISSGILVVKDAPRH
jgi:competence protein ComFB